MSPAGFVLCGLLTGADYGSTKVALSRPGVYEAGPIARHSLVGGAAFKAGACAGGEILLRDKRHKKARWIARGLQVALTGAIVVHNLRQRGSVGAEDTAQVGSSRAQGGAR